MISATPNYLNGSQTSVAIYIQSWYSIRQLAIVTCQKFLLKKFPANNTNQALLRTRTHLFILSKLFNLAWYTPHVICLNKSHINTYRYKNCRITPIPNCTSVSAISKYKLLLMFPRKSWEYTHRPESHLLNQDAYQ